MDEPLVTDGLPLAATYDVIGRGDAPTVVFLHGTRLTRAMWRPQIPLADRFRLVMTDLPGHGSLATTRFTLAAATAHASRVVDAVAGGRAVIVGQSLGGYVAMDLAARHPEQVAALVLCNCTLEPRTVARFAPLVVGGYLVGAAAESWRRGRAARNQAAAAAGIGSREAGAAAVSGRAGDGGNVPGPDGDGPTMLSAGDQGAGGAHDGGDDRPHDHPGHGDGRGSTTHVAAIDDGAPLLRHHEPPTKGWLFKGGTRALFTALGMSFLPRLAAYPGPTLIVNGAGDRVFRRGEARFLAAAANGRLVIIDGAHHVTSEETPETFNEVISDFVNEVGPG